LVAKPVNPFNLLLTPLCVAMSTTSIRLEEELKARIASAAARAGKSPHAFILDVLAATVERSDG